MSISIVNETRAPIKYAPYDTLGWVKSAFERSLDLVRRRLTPKLAYASAKTALTLVKNWHHDSNIGEEQAFEYAMLGVAADLFTEHPRHVLSELIAIGDWEDMSKTIKVNPAPASAQLLASVASDKHPEVMPTNAGMRIDVILALYCCQTIIPGASHVSPLYFDLSITGLKGWLLRDTEASTHRGTCKITGKETDVRTYVKDGAVIDMSTAGLRTVSGWKPARTLTVHAVKQVGMPVLGFCPCCITRRSVRSEDEEIDIPAFPLPSKYVEENEEVLSIGNPINTGQRVLTAAYIKVWPGKHGNIMQIRRQCPSCMALAIKHPRTYSNYITELNLAKGQGPTSPEMVKLWKAEFDRSDANEIRYQSNRETEQVISAMSSGTDIGEMKSLTVSKQERSLLDVAAAFQELSPGLLDDFVSFKYSKGKLRARLLDKVTLEHLAAALEIWGAFDLFEEFRPVVGEEE